MFAGLARHGADDALHLGLVVVIMHAGANQRVDAGRERIAFICSTAREFELYSARAVTTRSPARTGTE
jgi:hypothetical protein